MALLRPCHLWHNIPFHGQDISAEFAAERLVKLLAERLYQKLQLYFLSLED